MRLSPDALAGVLRPPPPKPKQPTSRERAAANRLAVLRAVAAHGHLRCADLAAACWPGARYGLQMAQRTVRVLVEQTGELLARRNCHGGTSVVLTRKGVAALELHGVAARHGLDLASVSGPTYAHFALTARAQAGPGLRGLERVRPRHWPGAGERAATALAPAQDARRGARAGHAAVARRNR